MENIQVIVGLGSCGIAAGAGKVYNKLSEINTTQQIKFNLKKTSCVGMCYREPLVEIIDNEGTYLYGEVDETKIIEIHEQHIINNKPLTKYIVKSDKFNTSDQDFFEEQKKIVLKNCGKINPEFIEEYEANEGYNALKKIINNKITPETIIKTILDSGIRGRGGGGFPTGLKWNFAYNNKSEKKYIICNADEGDPGAFMDRSLLEGDPHAVIEGMIIGAIAIGANEGYLYVRAEYPLAIKRLKIAIDQAKSKGYLGSNILGSKYECNLKIKEGAGAFVCGEETALIASIEGERGMPRPRPPFPAAKGLWEKPTIINNVETFGNIPHIIRNGSEAYAAIGTEKSKGTKVFALTGKIKRGGLVEVPMGMSLRNIIYKLGGGIQNDKDFKAVQLGGPSGGCIPKQLLDLPVEYDSLKAAGAMMGSGGMVVVDEATCMVDFAKFFLNFAHKESCGECAPCRLGTRQMLDILKDITQGKGTPEDIDLLESLGHGIIKGSLCGLGQTAPNPVLTTLRYFRNEYEDHILHKKCTAKVCKDLIHFDILEDKCTGCHICFKNCPVSAISGNPKETHIIDQNLCTKCGICMEKCPKKFNAIEKLSGSKTIKE